MKVTDLDFQAADLLDQEKELRLVQAEGENPLRPAADVQPTINMLAMFEQAIEPVGQEPPEPPTRGPDNGPDEPALEAQITDLEPPEDTPLTLHLDNAEIRKALEILSRQGPYNILVSEQVKGRVTANLEGLTFDESLDALLKLTNLTAHRERGLIYIYTADESAQIRNQDQKLATRIYRLRYIRGLDLEKMVVPFLTSGVGRISITPASDVGIKSDTSDVGGDSMAGGDVVVVQDYESALSTIEQIIQAVDVQPIQVIIEAVILELTLENSRDLGVNFAVLDGAQKMLAASGSAVALNAAGGFDPAQLLTAGGQIGGGPDGFVNNAHGIKFGFVDRDVTGFIRALDSHGRTRILASPRLLVLNKQRAELIIGEKIGYKILSVTQTSSIEQVEFLNVGTQLRLRPFVVENGLIRMEIHPERSSGSVVDGVPQTSTSEVTTNVMVQDGSTIVIGGLMEDREEVRESGVPGLSRLPWVGALFRRQFKAMVKKELIVLLTPRIWNPASGVPVPEPMGRAADCLPGVPSPGFEAEELVLPAPYESEAP